TIEFGKRRAAAVLPRTGAVGAQGQRSPGDVLDNIERPHRTVAVHAEPVLKSRRPAVHDRGRRAVGGPATIGRGNVHVLDGRPLQRLPDNARTHDRLPTTGYLQVITCCTPLRCPRIADAVALHPVCDQTRTRDAVTTGSGRALPAVA